MKRHLIVSPHSDDALFSLGSYISRLVNSPSNEVTILSPFAGIPPDEPGEKKHKLLRKEHTKACSIMGVNYINGDFLDDVYPATDTYDLIQWFVKALKGYDVIYVPLGIHHPDHITIRNLFVENFDFHYYYEELPYRVLYPALRTELLLDLIRGEPQTFNHEKKKEEAVQAYKSQLKSPDLLNQLFVTEIIWKKQSE